MRQFVRTTRIGLRIGLALTAAMVTARGLGGGGSPSVTAHPFEHPLPIPPLDRGTQHPGGTTEYTLEARSGQTDFGQGGTAQTIGYNGSYLGPTLLMRQGESVRVHLTNSLDEMTTLHGHGMHLPAQMDGGPHQMIHPRGTWSPTWQIRQPAATRWYHSHPHGETQFHRVPG